MPILMDQFDFLKKVGEMRGREERSEKFSFGL